MVSPIEKDAITRMRFDSNTLTENDIFLHKLQLRSPEEYKEKLEKLKEAYRTIIEVVGEDPEREGLIKTPERAAKAMLTLCRGYKEKEEVVVNGAVFNVTGDDMVIIRDIDIFSLCEHHLVPFHGKVHIGYIPNGKVLGLSKVARIAELYSRRLQIQETLTNQIAAAIEKAVSPLGVGVIVEATHMCMTMRGASKPSSWTTTSSMRGVFREDSRTREEFLSLIHAPKSF